MNIGMVGLGALGKPVALAMELQGHTLYGFDTNPDRMQKAHPFKERGPLGDDDFAWYLDNSRIQFVTLAQMVSQCDLIFLAIQTPHPPQFEGIVPLPAERSDFDYSHLRSAIQQVADAAKGVGVFPPVAIISTVLPGTIRREALPITEGVLPVAYTPQFISMGNVMQDYLNPELFLIGVHDGKAANTLRSFYRTISSAPQLATSIEDAEFIKVGYNVYIGVKIMFANLMGELSHRLHDTDIDTFTRAMSLSTRRLISAQYLRAGGGDGGQCHIRDGVALSWLARETQLSFNLFDAILAAREAHANFLCDLVCRYDLPKVILGTAFKAGSNIETGSAALLCKSLLEARGHKVRTYDPYVNKNARMLEWPSVYLIGTNHPEFADWQFNKGDVVVDPWGIIPDQDGVEVIRVGRR